VTNPNLVELAMRLVQGANTEPSAPNTLAALAADHAHVILQPAPQKPIEVQKSPTIERAPGSVDLSWTAPAKEKKAVDQLAAMILEDLSTTEGCPKRGVKVTVYGSNPWNSWLSFDADAGPVRNKADLQVLCEVITERLKRLYDV
jgi:hypothetical protein